MIQIRCDSGLDGAPASGRPVVETTGYNGTKSAFADLRAAPREMSLSRKQQDRDRRR